MAHDEKELAYRSRIKAALLIAERDVGIQAICGGCEISPQQYSRFKSALQLGREPLIRCKLWLETGGYYPPMSGAATESSGPVSAQWSIVADDFEHLANFLRSDTIDDATKAERFAYIVGSYHAKQEAFTKLLISKIKNSGQR